VLYLTCAAQTNLSPANVYFSAHDTVFYRGWRIYLQPNNLISRSATMDVAVFRRKSCLSHANRHIILVCRVNLVWNLKLSRRELVDEVEPTNPISARPVGAHSFYWQLLIRILFCLCFDGQRPCTTSLCICSPAGRGWMHRRPSSRQSNGPYRQDCVASRQRAAGRKVIAVNGVGRPTGQCAVSTELFGAPMTISYRFVFAHATPVNCYLHGTALTQLK